MSEGHYVRTHTSEINRDEDPDNPFILRFTEHFAPYAQVDFWFTAQFYVPTTESWHDFEFSKAEIAEFIDTGNLVDIIFKQIAKRLDL